MMRLKKFKFGYWLAGFIFTYSLISVAFAHENSPATDFVLMYRNEFTFILCIITLILGTWIGVKLPTKNGEADLALSVKFATALLGGVMAFTYSLQTDKGLTLMNPLWVGVASITLPLTILTLLDKVLAYAKAFKMPKSGE